MSKHFEHPETGYRLHAIAAARLRSDGLNQLQISEAALARLVYGDSGGWLLGRHGLQSEERRLVESLN